MLSISLLTLTNISRFSTQGLKGQGIVDDAVVQVDLDVSDHWTSFLRPAEFVIYVRVYRRKKVVARPLLKESRSLPRAFRPQIIHMDKAECQDEISMKSCIVEHREAQTRCADTQQPILFFCFFY